MEIRSGRAATHIFHLTVVVPPRLTKQPLLHHQQNNKMTNYDNSNTDEANFQEWKKRMEDECEARCEEAISSIKAHYDAIILRAQQQHDAKIKMRQLEAKEHNRDKFCPYPNFCATVFEYLVPKEIMSCRRVCKPWEEAAKMTTVPLKSYFKVDSVESYSAMSVMTRVLPNLQALWLWRIEPDRLGRGHKYNEGEDPNERVAARTANRTAHNIGIISNFSKLRDLQIHGAALNGRYPFLFNSFPQLQKLSISYSSYLKWDLEMLADLPVLKELVCVQNYDLTGNINSLRVLKDTLENVEIRVCSRIEGNFMDLADFPRLKELDLDETAITGDIRDISERDFPSLERLDLPGRVYGGRGYKLQRISVGPELMRAVYLLRKQRPALKMENWHGVLSGDSSDWYDRADDDDTPPFYVCFVEAGSRFGYRWESADDIPCEVNWLDPEPAQESNKYGQYIEEMQKINSQVKFYKGFHQPPTEEEYHRLCERLEEEGEWW